MAASAPSPVVYAACCSPGCPKGPWRHPFGGHSWLACCPQSWLQTGMQECLWKPQAQWPLVHVGQVITSICTKLQNKSACDWLLCRAKFKFSGHRKVHISPGVGIWGLVSMELENTVLGKVAYPRWLWGQVCPWSQLSEQMVGPALMRALVLSLITSPPINPTSCQKKDLCGWETFE